MCTAGVPLARGLVPCLDIHTYVYTYMFICAQPEFFWQEDVVPWLDMHQDLFGIPAHQVISNVYVCKYIEMQTSEFAHNAVHIVHSNYCTFDCSNMKFKY